MKKIWKKAKSIFNKVRGEVKKAFKKKAGGNWYNPRKQSESARSFIRNQPVVYFAAPVMHCVSRFTRGNSGILYYIPRGMGNTSYKPSLGAH